MFFCDWLISLSSVSLNFIHVVACVRISLLFKAEYYSVVRIYHICPVVHPWTLGCFYFLAIINFGFYAAVKIHVQVVWGTYIFSSLYMYLGVKFLGYMIILCLILRNYQTVFYSDCTIFLSYHNAQEFQSLHILVNTCEL